MPLGEAESATTSSWWAVAPGGSRILPDLQNRPQDCQGPWATGFLWLDPLPGELLAARPLGIDTPFLLQQSWEDIQGQLYALESYFSGFSALSPGQKYKINLQFYTLKLQVPYKVQCFSGASSLFGF